MSFIWNFPLFTVVLSLFSGVLCMMLSAKAARYYTIAYESVLVAMTGSVLWFTWRKGRSFTYPMGEFPAPWGNEIRAGSLEALIALLFAVVLLCSVTAGFHFIRKDIDKSKINLYFSILNLMTAALMALAWTNDVFTGYVFLEILTLTSCGILIVREIGRTTLAAVRYMILNLMGSGLFLMGIVLLYDLSGHLLMIPMRQSLAQVVQDPAAIPVLSVSIGIMTVGIAIKTGLFPFYFWMPDTYGRATPTSGAVLSGLVTKAYIFLLFKIYYRAIGIQVLQKTPVLKILFVLGMGAAIYFGGNGNRDLRTFVAQSVAAVALVFLLATSMFPNLVVASANSVGPSITVATAASSDLALTWMTGIACIGVPLVLAYHVVAYRIFRGRLALNEREAE